MTQIPAEKHSPRSEMTMAVYACWVNSMGSVYQYLDRSEITDSYGSNSPDTRYITFWWVGLNGMADSWMHNDVAYSYGIYWLSVP